VIHIDGSQGEGGGQVLRTALALSALTGRATRLHRIRARRKNPGLAPQHLTGVQALARLCQAEVQGAALGSTELTFAPQAPVSSGAYTFDVAQAAKGGSAGSVTLLLQTLLLPLAAASGDSHLALKGGTHVPWSPPFEYLAQVFLPAMARLGLRVESRLEGWGFYPMGGGQLLATIHGGGPLSLQPLVLVERGPLLQVQGTAVSCNLPAHVAQRLADRACGLLLEAGLPCQIIPTRVSGPGPGAGLFLTAVYENISAGFSALGEKGKPAPLVAEEAVADLLAYHRQDAPLDPHLADQLILPLSLAAGSSRFRTSALTRHLLTNAQVIGQFLPAVIHLEGEEGQAGAVLVEGAPHVR
jgi:RNA 3'-terminal phosphate cyclase (ATP)